MEIEWQREGKREWKREGKRVVVVRFVEKIELVCFTERKSRSNGNDVQITHQSVNSVSFSERATPPFSYHMSVPCLEFAAGNMI